MKKYLLDVTFYAGSNDEEDTDTGLYILSVDKDIKNYPGVYDVTYTLDFNGAKLKKVRKVKVVSKPIFSEDANDKSEEPDNNPTGKNDGLKVDKTDRIKIKLKGYSHVYLLKGMVYNDEGVLAVTVPAFALIESTTISS